MPLFGRLHRAQKYRRSIVLQEMQAFLNRRAIVPIKSNDLNGLLGFALKEKINLTVVGPEDPLTRGIVDLFESKGLSIFGADRRQQRLKEVKPLPKR